jgi:hypothetical protein
MSNFITPNGELLNCALFEPLAMPSGRARFFLNIDLAETDGRTILAWVEEVARVRWPDRNLSELHLPLVQGGRIWQFTAYSPTQPGVFDADLAPITESNQIQPGAQVRVHFSLAAYVGFNDRSDGVSARLLGVMKMDDATKLTDSRTAFSQIRDARKQDEADPPF